MSHPLHEVYRDAVAQAETGKGFERHGHKDGFYEQRWRYITDEVGGGFLLGQAIKKIAEATRVREKGSPEWERELLGALNYLAMTLLYERRYGAYQSTDKKGSDFCGVAYFATGNSKRLEGKD